MEHTSGGLNETFQTTGRQGDFHPNHRRVMRNYPIYLFKNTNLYFQKPILGFLISLNSKVITLLYLVGRDSTQRTRAPIN